MFYFSRKYFVNLLILITLFFTLLVPGSVGASYNMDYLIVAGGGGGGSGLGGGGGGGGYREGSVTVSGGAHYITVGSGGAGGTGDSQGSNGGDSSFYGVTATGGGAGGGWVSNGSVGGSGGGAGGGAGDDNVGGSGTSGQGYRGGHSNGYGAGGQPAGGGGGGADGEGTEEMYNNGGNGGPGRYSSMIGGYHSGGGGGASYLWGYDWGGSLGGRGGGGNGFSPNGNDYPNGYCDEEAKPATANTGGGGGGGGNCGNPGGPGGAGGSGIVVIKYAGSPKASGGSISESGGATTHTFYSSGTFTVMPPTPTGFWSGPSTCGNNWINLSWNASAGATSYQVYRNGSLIYNGSALSVSDAGLTIGASYSYTITASNGGGTSASASSGPTTVASYCSCASTPWGTVSHGYSNTAYQASTVPYGSTCSSQTRSCSNGTMSGSYTATTCSVTAAANCTAPWGASVTHGSSVTAYAAATADTCSSQTRTCTNGSLSGNYAYGSCTANPATVTTTVTPSSVQSPATFRVTMSSTNASSCTWSRTGSYSGNWTTTSLGATSYDSGLLSWSAGNATWTFSCVNSVGTGNSSSGSVTVTPPVLNGGWTPWSPSSCPVSCGLPASSQTRSCTNPSPAYGGASCVGETAQTCPATASCNTAPNAPTISGPTTGYPNTNYTYTFTATDTQGDQVRYGIDWDMNGVADEWLPAGVTYVSSGTSRNTTYSTSTAGLKTFRALTQDAPGLNSAWTNYSVTFSAAPVNGACGTANKSYPIGSTSYGGDTYCSAGVASTTLPYPSLGFPSPGGSSTWACNGTGGGAASGTCTASNPLAIHNIEIDPTPKGTVESFNISTGNPDSAIDCGTRCDADYTEGTTVYLRAYPVSSFWKFSGWSGDCSGTTNICILEVDGPNLSVTPSFEPRLFDYLEF